MKPPSLLLLSTLTCGLVVASGYATIGPSSAGTNASPLSGPAGASDALPTTIAAATHPGNTGEGKRIYAERCAICHDKGGMGPTFKGEKSAMGYAATVAWIKDPKPPMPKLYPSRLSDGDVNDVAAYVQTLASTSASPMSASKGKAHAKGKMVADTGVSASQGKKLYGQSCAGCHGAIGTEGGAGPSLKGEKNKKDRAAVIAWIKNPQPPMPKLYPTPLSATDVSAIAAYIETL